MLKLVVQLKDVKLKKLHVKEFQNVMEHIQNVEHSKPKNLNFSVVNIENVVNSLKVVSEQNVIVKDLNVKKVKNVKQFVIKKTIKKMSKMEKK